MTSSRWSEPSANDKTKGRTQMELSACIVVYNGAGEAIRAAQTVLDCTRRYPLTLYLVDNASPDGSGQQLTAAAKDGTLRTVPGQTVQVLCRLENGGFGTGMPRLPSNGAPSTPPMFLPAQQPITLSR